LKVNLLQENVSRCLSLVGKAIPVKAFNPITYAFLIKAEGDKVTVVATNLETTISSWVSAKVDEGGELAIPAKLLSELVSALPNEVLNFSTDRSSMKVSCGKVNSRISGLDSKDFPAVAFLTGTACKVKPSNLISAVSNVSFLAANEGSRPILTGVNLRFEEKDIVISAADGLRLGVFHLPYLVPSKENFSLTVPRKALEEISRFCSSEQEQVEILVNENKSQIQFSCKHGSFIAQCLNGEYPDVNGVIPKTCSTKIEVNAKEVKTAIRAASIFLDKEKQHIKLEITEDKLLIMAPGIEAGESATEVDAKVTGKPLKIAVNGFFLKEAIDCFSEEKVTIEMSAVNLPLVFRREGYVQAMAPMFVSGWGA